MGGPYIPKTEAELASWMKSNCYNFDGYSINGSSITEGFGIDKFGTLYVWFYTERGQTHNLKYFLNERDIVEYARRQIKADAWAKTHCIGFTTVWNEKVELEGILKNRNVDFFQDEIPYYGPNKLAYRTFVIGCDIQKVEDLKEKYYKV